MYFVSIRVYIMYTARDILYSLFARHNFGLVNNTSKRVVIGVSMSVINFIEVNNVCNIIKLYDYRRVTGFILLMCWLNIKRTKCYFVHSNIINEYSPRLYTDNFDDHNPCRMCGSPTNRRVLCASCL